MIDLRTLRPLDDARRSSPSVAKTRRAVVVDEGWRSGSLSAEIDRAHRRAGASTTSTRRSRACARAEVPIPYPKHLEEAALPQVRDASSGAAQGDAGAHG